MGTQRTRPYHSGAAGATSIAEAEILFSDAGQDVVVLPPGCVIIRVWAEVLAVFNAATTNVLTVGLTGNQEKYLATADIAEGAVGVSVGKGPYAVEVASVTIRAFFSQTGTAATTGKARIFVEFARLAV